jgi:hypothetical protein
MAVIKHAQKVVDTVISAQVMKPLKFPEDHYLTPMFKEAPRIFDQVPPPSEGNLSQLKTGLAQHLRVNNPYRFTETDEYGNLTFKGTKWGCYKGFEVGGNRKANMGALWAHYFHDLSADANGKKKPTARIYYVMHTHMHRMASMRKKNCTGGPFQIMFEEDGGFKNPLDGYNMSRSPGYWVGKGFGSIEDAVNYCERFGIAYEVEVPRFRHLTRKSYAENFKYKPLKSDD